MLPETPQILRITSESTIGAVKQPTLTKKAQLSLHKLPMRLKRCSGEQRRLQPGASGSFPLGSRSKDTLGLIRASPSDPRPDPTQQAQLSKCLHAAGCRFVLRRRKRCTTNGNPLEMRGGVGSRLPSLAHFMGLSLSLCLSGHRCTAVMNSKEKHPAGNVHSQLHTAADARHTRAAAARSFRRISDAAKCSLSPRNRTPEKRV